MILLPIQFKLIIYHLICGWTFALFYHFEHSIISVSHKKYLKWLIEFIFITILFFSYYFGLYLLNNGLTFTYGIICFLVGFFIYYYFYFNTLNFLVVGVTRTIVKFIKLILLVFMRISSIMNIHHKKWRKQLGKHTKQKKKNKKSDN